LSKQTDRGQSGRRRSELERLLDRTVLEPTHPERAENQRHLRKMQCSQGHPLSGANLRINANGTRIELATQQTSRRSGNASASARIPDNPPDEYQISHRRK
jgi:hypothetical protein